MMMARRPRGVAAAGLASVLGVLLASLPGEAPAKEGCGASYTVRAGDTLAGIAERCGTTVEALLEANARVENPARISVGWELSVPSAGAAPPASPSASLGPESEVRPRTRDEAAQAAVAEGAYEVRPGESFASIATGLQIPMRALRVANEGIDPFALRPGQRLLLPSDAAAPAGGEARSRAPETAPDTAPRTADEASLQDPSSRPEATGAAAQPEGAMPEDGQARSEVEPEGAAKRLLLQGRVGSGAECPVLETPGGEVYSLVSAEYGFMPGEYVEIEGETVEMSFCMQGSATVRVTSMSTVPPPQGG